MLTLLLLTNITNKTGPINDHISPESISSQQLKNSIIVRELLLKKIVKIQPGTTVNSTFKINVF